MVRNQISNFLRVHQFSVGQLYSNLESLVLVTRLELTGYAEKKYRGIMADLRQTPSLWGEIKAGHSGRGLLT